MDEKRVIVTGIGGNVGQGVIRNIRATDYNIKIIGTNIEAFSAGNHLCDVFYKVPFANHPEYIQAIKKIVIEEKIDLIIPTTDFEVFYLSAQKDEIPCEIVVSHKDTTYNYLDKYKTYQHLNTHKVPFATSFLPSQYKNEFQDIILKPRQGRGSRGLQINPKNYASFSDEEYMIQELHKGEEITTAFYVDKSQNLHGFITLERILENGTTTHCKVVTAFDEKIKQLLLNIIAVSKIHGSANVQSIVTKTGDIIPFEINCRISGTNSIRANFGFKDVAYTLQEWLYDEKPAEPVIKEGIATRVLMDVIYEDAKSFEEAQNNNAKHFLY